MDLIKYSTYAEIAPPEPLNLGVAYHSNRITEQVREDMKDTIRHHMNLVQHTFSFNDMKRHLPVMKDIISITESFGLDCWINCYGIGGPPGEVSNALSYCDNAHQVKSDGTVDPDRGCFNNKSFRDFMKKWIDAAKECGTKKIMWDEPHFWGDADGTYRCTCDTCKKLFKEKYGKDMPRFIDDDVRVFQKESLEDYFGEITEYAHQCEIENIIAIMPESLGFYDSLIKLPYVDNMGCDPYWTAETRNPYGKVYSVSKEFVKQTTDAGKKAHIWIQAHYNPTGREEEVTVAADAAYDAGARTILAWSYRGGEACFYRSDNPERVWDITGEAMRRIKDRHMDAERERMRKYLAERGEL